jgi:glutathione S-transferase
MPASRTLVVLHVSPWSERARWALDHHHLEYTAIEHVPILGERRLRRLVGPDPAQATVPVLIVGTEVLKDSWDIARYAEREGRRGNAAPLIGAGREAEVKRWVDIADEAAQSGRALILAKTLANPTAMDENLPPLVPSFARPLFRPVTRALTWSFVRKYELALGEHDAQVRAVKAALDALRKGLAASSPYLLGVFGYADIAMATLVQGVSPVADRFLKLGPATRNVWTQPELAAEYGDLVAWRDALYEKHRRNAVLI